MMAMTIVSGLRRKSSQSGLAVVARVAAWVACARIWKGISKSAPKKMPNARPDYSWRTGGRLCEWLFPGWPQQAPRVATHKVMKPPSADGAADIRHEALVEPHIMHGNEHRSKHLGREKKVADGA